MLRRQLCADPGHDVLMVVLGVLHGHVQRPDAESLEQRGEVAAVLVLLALGHHDEPATVAYERLEHVDLVGRQDGRPDPGDALPRAIGGMRQHDNVAIGEGLRGEQSDGVGVDEHPAFT